MKKLAILLSLFLSLTFAGDYYNKNGVVLEGYDLVGYHTQNKAILGSDKYATTHDGQTYHFSSEANLEAFKKDPKAYLPAYDGFCAYALAKMSKKVSVDPKTFKIQDGKLLFFFNGPMDGKDVNTLVPWNEDPQTMSKEADAKWIEINK